MATYTIIKLKNLTPIHIGTGKENYDFSSSMLHSDTLSAALASVRASEGKVNDLRDFLNTFSISSAFPYVNDTLFLPKPQGKTELTVTDMEEYSSRKKIKKIGYIDFNLWHQVIAGKAITVSRDQLQGEFLLSKDNAEHFRSPNGSQVNQRVAVPHNDEEPANPFFFEWTFFNRGSGLYCIVDASDETADEIVRLFGKLGECGIGTDRNVGGGFFEVEADKISISSSSDANAQMLLSLYIPTEEELQKLNLTESRYELVLRGGFMSGSEVPEFRHLRKKSVYMFKEGSLFRTATQLSGSVVNLQPSWNDAKMHPTWRSGKPFVIPIKLP